MRRKFWKITGIVLGLLLVLVLLFVLAFIFNPFEGSLTDIRELVPTDTDYFARKTDLDGDFRDFPEPHFWAEVGTTKAMADLQKGPRFAALLRDAGIGRSLEQVRELAERVRDDSGGMVDLLGDVLGREVVVAGRLDGGPNATTGFCVYFRVSWKVRFAWGLLEWQSIRDRIAASGTRIARGDDGVMTIEADGAAPLKVARWLDCVIVSNDATFLERSLELARTARGGESFGGSAEYREFIEPALKDWQERTQIRPNAIEFYARPDRLFGITTWDDNWPDPAHSTDLTERVLASFLNLSGWRFLSGALIFDEGSLSLLGRVDMNRNKHSGFQNQFFRAEAQERREWLNPFLSMVPSTACAAAALRVPAGDFLQEMIQAIEPELRREIDGVIRKTGKFDSLGHVIDSIRPALLQRVGFVFHPRMDIGVDDKGKPIETFEPSPAPHVAWVFWVDPRFRNKVEDLIPFLTLNASTLGFSSAYDLPVQGGAGGDAARELVNPNIPSTGEIALLLYGSFFVVGNSGPLIKRMVDARLNANHLMTLPGYEVFSGEMSDRLNGFAYLHGDALVRVAEDYLSFAESGSAEPDAAWMVGIRPTLERDVLRDLFPAYRTPSSLSSKERERFDAEIGKRMRERWTTERPKATAAGRANYAEMHALFRTFSALYFETTFDPQWMSLRARLLPQIR
jgi:hypothetical protein